MEAYEARTKLPCSPLSFQDISLGQLPAFIPLRSNETPSPPLIDEQEPILIDMVICSFALHLVESPSELFALLWELSTKANWLVIISPHKKPEVSRPKFYITMLTTHIENWGRSKKTGVGHYGTLENGQHVRTHLQLR